MPETTKALLAEVHSLNEHVTALSNRLDVGAKALRRLRIITYTTAALVIACILTTGALVILNARLSDAAVAACENRNEQARGHRALWTYVIEVSKRNNPDSDFAREKYYEAMQGYINDLYSARDCTDLERKYPVPDPPPPPPAK